MPQTATGRQQMKGTGFGVPAETVVGLMRTMVFYFEVTW